MGRDRRTESSVLSKTEADNRTLSEGMSLCMNSFRTMGKNASASAQQLAAELTMDESSLIPEEQPIYMIRESSFLSKIIEKDSDGDEETTNSLIGKECPKMAMIERLSPVSEGSHQSMEDELVALKMIHSRLLRDQAASREELDKQYRPESSNASFCASSDSSSSITDRGASLFYDMEVLRKTSKEPLYQYRGATEESVKGHMVVFDITETMKEVVRVVLDLQRGDLAGILMALLEDLVSTLEVLKCGGPARRRLIKLKETVTEQEGTSKAEKNGKPDVMQTEEPEVAWPDDEVEETPELELLKYSAADLKEEDPQLVLKHLKASLAVMRGIQQEDYPLEELKIIKTSEKPITSLEEFKSEQAPGVILARLKSSLAVLRGMKNRLRGSTQDNVKNEEAPEVVLERLKLSLRALRETVSEQATKTVESKQKETPEV